MKVFVSSLIRGFADLRDAASRAVGMLGHEVVRAEDFGASPDSPQSACLAAVRECDVTVLILGADYGYPQAAGLSATHEEYREARDRCPVIVFIARGVEPADDRQRDFIREVQGWEDGHYTSDFADPGDLERGLVRALHDFEVASTGVPLDEDALARRSLELLPSSRASGSAGLVVSVTGGPERQVLRPAQLEDPELQRYLLAEALTGPGPVLATTVGTDQLVEGDRLILRQQDGSGLVAIDERGGVLVGQPALERDAWATGIATLIEEDVVERLTLGLRFAGRVLDHVDGPRRLTHVAVTAALLGVGYLGWRTRSERNANPNVARMGTGNRDRIAVQLSPAVRRRSALLQDADEMAEDIAVRLRREVTQ